MKNRQNKDLKEMRGCAASPAWYVIALFVIAVFIMDYFLVEWISNCKCH